MVTEETKIEFYRCLEMIMLKNKSKLKIENILL